MTYWWVNNRRTYKHERNGGYLWAPFKDKSGNTPHHWATMSKLKKGDKVFCYVNGKIVSMATVLSQARKSDWPSEFGKAGNWEKVGRKAKLEYLDIEPPIEIKKILKSLASLLPDKYSPLTKNGRGNQGYLYKIGNDAGKYLEKLANDANEKTKVKVSRICWNTNGWKNPSGRDGKSKNVDAYESEHGFGHEEWLLDTSKVIEGWHYGFVQALHHNLRKYNARVFDIYLYTINSKTKERFWVGKINNAYVVNEAESKSIYQKYKSNGWLDGMYMQLKQANLDPKVLKKTTPNIFFNLKYNPDDLDLLDEPQLFSSKDPAIKSTYYTTLLNFTGLPKFNIKLDKGFIFKPGHSSGKTKSKRKMSRSTKVTDLFHNEMQNRIYKQLSKEYGEKNIGTENNAGLGNLVDVVRKDNNKYVFYELKTSNSLRLCIREALSQLMEYAYWTQEKNVKELVIVSQNPIDEDGGRYLQFVRNSLNIPVYYQRYDQDKKMLEQQKY